MTEKYRKDGDETPWGIPHKTYWDLEEGASVRRAQWVLDNCPDVSLDELQRDMALQPDEVAQLSLRPETGPKSVIAN